MLELLAGHPDINEIHVIFSEAAHRVMQEEENLKISSGSLNSTNLLGFDSKKLLFLNPRDIAAPVASGSYKVDGMLIVPCSMSTLASIASGVQQNLIHRAADVIIKEKRKLVLVPRETPLSEIHLENMLKLTRLGAYMVAAMPGFYHQPESIQDLVDMQCMKILDCMDLENSLVTRWKENKKLPLNLIKV